MPQSGSSGRGYSCGVHPRLYNNEILKFEREFVLIEDSLYGRKIIIAQAEHRRDERLFTSQKDLYTIAHLLIQRDIHGCRETEYSLTIEHLGRLLWYITTDRTAGCISREIGAVALVPFGNESIGISLEAERGNDLTRAGQYFALLSREIKRTKYAYKTGNKDKAIGVAKFFISH